MSIEMGHRDFNCSELSEMTSILLRSERKQSVMLPDKRFAATRRFQQTPMPSLRLLPKLRFKVEYCGFGAFSFISRSHEWTAFFARITSAGIATRS